MKKALLPILAAFMVLALFAPAAAAGDYSDNPQFMSFNSPEKLSLARSPDGGTTVYNAEAAPEATRTAVRTLSSEDWPQFMHDAANTGYSPCDNIPADSSVVNSTSSLGIDVIGSINPVVFKNATGHKKVLVMTGYAGFEEPDGLTKVNLTCIDWYNGQMSVDWVQDLPRTNISSGYYSNSWSSAATDGTYAFASSDNKTICVRVSDGQLMWTFTTYYDNCNGGPTVTDNYVFCSDWGGNYYCLYKNNGTMKWVFNNADTFDYDMTYSQATPAFDPTEGDEGKIYVTGWGYDSVTQHTGFLYKVDVATGTEDWSYGIGNSESFCGSVSVDDDCIFVASYSFGSNGKLYKISKDGSTVTSQPIERTDATPSIDKARDRVYISGGWNGGIYGSATPGVRCYSTSNLNLLWSRINQNMGGWTCSVAIGKSDEEGDKLVFAGRETGNNNYPSYCYNTTYALYDAYYGGTSWNYPAGGATAAIAWDEVYTVDHEGDLYIFS